MREPFAENFSGFTDDLDVLRQHIPDIKTAITRTNAGLAKPVKIVENALTGDATEDRGTLGYVKLPVIKDDGTLKSVSKSKFTKDDIKHQVSLLFLDPGIKPSSIYINFKVLPASDVKAAEAAKTVYHEATHKFVHTDDNVGYGRGLGISNAFDKTKTNADCYAWYVTESSR